MKKILLFTLLVSASFAVRAADDFAGATANPYAGDAGKTPVLADGVRLNAAVVENVYLMPEQITKLIFPKPVEEVSVNSMMVQVKRNPDESKESYLLLSPKVGKGDIDMHIVMDGQTFTFRLIIGSSMVNYRKTYTVQGSAASAHHLPKVPPLAPSEINTVNLIKMIQNSLHDENYANVINRDLGVSPQNINYLWNGAEVSLIDAWHYYKQDVVILRVEVHNPTSKAIYLSAAQMEPTIANSKFDALVVEQGTKILLPGQTDVKYLFLQGYALDIEAARFELRLPPTADQLKAEVK